MMCQQDPNLQLSLARRVTIYIIGVVESMLFAGIIFGWPQLVYVLKVEGLYSDLCRGSSSSVVHDDHNEIKPTSTLNLFYNNSRCLGLNNTFEVSRSHAVGVEQCGPQDERFALISTVSVSCYSIPGILVGYLLHHAGLRVTRISAGTMLSLGFLLLGMTTTESPNILFPAMILLALGGNQTRLAVAQFGDLFPLQRATAITLLSGMYAASAGLFIVFQYTASVGIPRAHVCWFLAALSSLSVFLSFIMPVHHIPVTDTYGADPKAAATQSATQAMPLSKSLLTGSFFLNQYWFFMCLFAVNTYQQSYNVWITKSSCSVEEVGVYSMMYSYSNLLTVFISPLGGAFTDCMIKRASKTTNEVARRVKEVQAYFWPLLVTTVAAMVNYGCTLFFQPAAIYVSLISMVIARPCTVAISTAYIRARFPADHFNRLLGIIGTVTSVIMFLQYPLFIWSQHMYYPAHALVLSLLALSYLNPIHLLFTPLMRHAVIVRDQLDQSEIGCARITRGPPGGKAPNIL
ncbi:solute carrier family 43 member 3-like [Homarus americanus]|uniref:Solute carrier family 43 member 3-like 1 n=1 Tax=Homarus americanus TaxID=6706 RepID=A0A8J5K5D7_HOMAM|nr:solute carrier family 43 member 3-like [Homarus americanus]XP_042220963.1 solute carrier family 43 member 3-like [Homarus americanus]KAG7169756.1 Solute carrier family 43 member 3-like 1 [Homarus americanus]